MGRDHLWSKGIQELKQKEFEIVLRMANKGFSVREVTKIMHVNRRGYQYWKKKLLLNSTRENSRGKIKEIIANLHALYPTAGYRRLNAFIKQEEGLILSDNYVHRLCKKMGIKSVTKKLKVKGNHNREMTYSNELASSLEVTSPYNVIVSDMTMIKHRNKIYELTLFLDIYNNEIISYGIGEKRGDRNSYFIGKDGLFELKKKIPDAIMILHTDQGTIYASKSFNEGMEENNIIRSMSRVGHPRDNAVIEALIGWIKEELYSDFHFENCLDPIKTIEEYIYYFNHKRPSSRLGYMTPIEYRLSHSSH